MPHFLSTYFLRTNNIGFYLRFAQIKIKNIWWIVSFFNYFTFICSRGRGRGGRLLKKIAICSTQKSQDTPIFKFIWVLMELKPLMSVFRFTTKYYHQSCIAVIWKSNCLKYFLSRGIQHHRGWPWDSRLDGGDKEKCVKFTAVLIYLEIIKTKQYTRQKKANIYIQGETNKQKMSTSRGKNIFKMKSHNFNLQKTEQYMCCHPLIPSSFSRLPVKKKNTNLCTYFTLIQFLNYSKAQLCLDPILPVNLQ